MPDHGTVEHSSLHLDLDGLAAGPLQPAGAALFRTDKRADVAGLYRELAEHYRGLVAATDADPAANPVSGLALEISRRMERGELAFDALEQLVQYLSADGFLRRAERMSRYLGTVDPETNIGRLTALFRRLARPEGAEAPIPYAQFAARVEAELFGIVITAHPTFNLSGELMTVLTMLATGRDEGGAPLGEARRRELMQRVLTAEHRPDQPLSLAREHALSLIAIGNIQRALRQVYEVVLDVAREAYPAEWKSLTPRLISVASWVGYDLDGRSDIKWNDILHKRMTVQAMQLRYYMDEVREVRAVAQAGEDLRQTLDLIESRLALAINEVGEEVAMLAGGAETEAGLDRVRRVGRRMYEGLELRLVEAGRIVELIDRAQRLSADEAVQRRLGVMRAELANYGLGMAHTHVRINATQVHNAIRKTVGMETAPDDPRYRQSYLNALNELLEAARPQTVNFGSVIAERTSAKRLFMVVAQMLKYSDSRTPVRFLIAECESAFTCLTALYYARLFGIDDRLDISPLFETEKALELGSRVIDQLLENPHYRAYIRKRGRLCIQTGYSDAGRYLGQTPAAASIERLRLRCARLFAKHGLHDVTLLVFDTHGESIGRGCHPRSLRDRLSYVATPHALNFLAEYGVPYKQEVSFQGGDGYQYFVTQPGALAVVTEIVEYMLTPPDQTADPFYEESDYIREFFTTVKEFQVDLMRDPNYGALLSAFAGNLLYPSGSRATKRQHDAASDEIDYAHPSQLRAIPHNAVLMQLGLLANTVGGLGAAIDKDPERFRAVYARSPRFRQLIGMAEYGLALSNVHATKGYVELLDPDRWVTRSAKTPDPHRRADMRALAAHIDASGLFERQLRIFRKLHRDAVMLEDGLASLNQPGCGALVDGDTRLALAVLHALRLALIGEIFLLATHIPEFSSQHGITLKRLVQRILHLDVDGAVALLEGIFPATGEAERFDDFGEPATYVSDESQNYQRENERIFKPMKGLYELARRTSIAVAHRTGFFG